MVWFVLPLFLGRKQTKQNKHKKNIIKMASFIAKFDAYPRTIEDFRIKTYGGAISIKLFSFFFFLKIFYLNLFYLF